MSLMARYAMAYMPNLIEMVVAIIFGCMGIIIKNLTRRYIDNETKRTVAKDIVRAVEQIYHDLHGADKFNAAAEFFREQLEQYGIVITEREMQILIESAVNEFNRTRTEE